MEATPRSSEELDSLDAILLPDRPNLFTGHPQLSAFAIQLFITMVLESKSRSILIYH